MSGTWMAHPSAAMPSGPAEQVHFMSQTSQRSRQVGVVDVATGAAQQVALEYEDPQRVAALLALRPDTRWRNESNFLLDSRLEFIDENDGGPGVRLKKTAKGKGRK